MIICLAGTKGGSGRSTTATNFACIAAGQGMKVLMVDADDQETSADFTAARKQDHPDAPSYTCIKPGGRDTTSQRAALSVSDVLLIPFAPRSFDIWTVDKVATLIEEMRAVNPTLKALAFLNRTDPQGQGTENEEAAELLRGVQGLIFIDAPIRFRKAYAHAACQGLVVTELTGQYRNAKTNDEIMKLF